MAHRYFSKEWLEECVKKANSDPEYLKKTAKFNAKTWIIVTDCPDGRDVSVKFTYEKGKVAHYEYEAKPAPADFRIGGKAPWNESISLFRAQASYATWTKLQKRELNAMGAMNAKLYRIEGDMIKILSLMSHVTAYSDLQATIPCEY